MNSGKLNTADRRNLGSFPRSPGRAPVPKPAPPASYAPGYFTALIRKHDWPPQFEPQFELAGRWSDARQSIETRERQAVGGVGWGGGTVLLPGTPSQQRPKMAKRGAR